MQYLAFKNIAFYGHAEDKTSNGNPGNFLLLCSYQSYDPAMRDHLE